ncbi:MAG: hypothetical protein JSW52_03310 [Candidatus Coatesbacteria bacterium]|nr:MAG: hypothetical protein JSW52_03310 [Candidatus Coatesbacteria bacterium]
MKYAKATLIILLTTATLAAATHEYPAIFATWYDFNNQDYLSIIDIDTGDILDIIELDFRTYGLTWDGEYYWVIKDGSIHRFDRNGDFVSSFPSPAPYPLSLAFDGDYLWIGCFDTKYTSTVYCLNLDGTPGTYSPFSVEGYSGLAICEDDIFSINVEVYQYDLVTFGYRYQKDGSFVGSFRFIDDSSGDYFGESLGSNGVYLYLGYISEEMGEYEYGIAEYDTDGNLVGYGYYPNDALTVIGIPGLSFGYTYGTNINMESFGRIKAFFGNEDEGE